MYTKFNIFTYNFIDAWKVIILFWKKDETIKILYCFVIFKTINQPINVSVEEQTKRIPNFI